MLDDETVRRAGAFQKRSRAWLGRSSEAGAINRARRRCDECVLGWWVCDEGNEAVGKGKRLADGNYWTATSGEDDAVSDFDESERRGQRRRVGYARGRGEGAGAEAAGAGEAV